MKDQCKTKNKRRQRMKGKNLCMTGLRQYKVELYGKNNRPVIQLGQVFTDIKYVCLRTFCCM